MNEGTRIGDMTLCRVCNKAIQLLRSRNPHTHVDIDFWVHFASLDIKGPSETHKAIAKRCWSDSEDNEWGEIIHPDGSSTPLEPPQFAIPEGERAYVINRPGLVMWTRRPEED